MNKFLDFIKKCPLVVAILVVWLGLSVASFILGTAKLEVALETPLFANLLVKVSGAGSDICEGELVASGSENISSLVGEGVDVTPLEPEEDDYEYIYEDADDGEEHFSVYDDFDDTGVERPDSFENDSTGDEDSESDLTETPEAANPEEGNVEETDEPKEPVEVKPKFVKYDKIETNSIYYTDPGKYPKTTEYDYEEVGMKYFHDALFIGDSRTVGLANYTDFDEEVTFYAKTGLSIFNMMTDKFVENEKGKLVTVENMLSKHSFKKIYICVGINELGIGNTARFAAEYQAVIEKIKELQPEAIIFVQSILPVTAKKDAEDPVINNTNIRDKNVAIAKLTNGIDIFYLDIYSVYADDSMNMADGISSDEIHMYAKYYASWKKFLMKHGVKTN